MSDVKHLLAIKKEKKARAPEFIRQDSWLRLKIGNKPRWRKPKGKHPRVEIGYRNPALVRGLTLTGMTPKLIHNIAELQRLNKQTDIAIVSATVGLKSKLEIAKKAQELGIMTNLKQDKLNGRLAALKKQHEDKKIATKETKKAEAKEGHSNVQPKAALGGNQEEPQTERGQSPLAVRKETKKAESKEQKADEKAKPAATTAQTAPTKTETKTETAPTAKDDTAKPNQSDAAQQNGAVKQKREPSSVKRG